MDRLIRAEDIPLVDRNHRRPAFNKKDMVLYLPDREISFNKILNWCRIRGSDLFYKLPPGTENTSTEILDFQGDSICVAKTYTEERSDNPVFEVGFTLGEDGKLDLRNLVSDKMIREVFAGDPELTTSRCWDETYAYSSDFFRRVNGWCCTQAISVLQEEKVVKQVEIHESKHVADLQASGYFGQRSAFSDLLRYYDHLKSIWDRNVGRNMEWDWHMYDRIRNKCLALDSVVGEVGELTAIIEESREQPVDGEIINLSLWRLTAITSLFKREWDTGKARIEKELVSIGEHGYANVHIAATLIIIGGEDICRNPRDITTPFGVFDRQKLFGYDFRNGDTPTEIQLERAKDVIMKLLIKRLKETEGDGVPMSAAYIDNVADKMKKLLAEGYENVRQLIRTQMEVLS